MTSNAAKGKFGHIGELIEKRIKELEAEIGAKLSDVDDVTELAATDDPRELAFNNELAEVERAEVQRDLGELRLALQARDRLANGQYGSCQSCGKPIAAARLAAQPFALNCIDCQSRLEAEAR